MTSGCADHGLLATARVATALVCATACHAAEGVGGSGQDTGVDSAWQSVTIDESHACGVTASGAVECVGGNPDYWGDLDEGQWDAPSGRFVQVSTGVYHTCAIQADDGGLTCWGMDNYGQSSPPTDVGYVKVSCGFDYSCAVHESGAVRCWGWDYTGETTPPESSAFVDVAARLFSACGVTVNGEITCWGHPLEVKGGSDRYVQIDSSVESTEFCALNTEGSPYCLDDTSMGPGVPLVKVTGGHGAYCGLDADGSAVCWGEPFEPVDPPTDAAFLDIDHSYYFACAVDGVGPAQCWGFNMLTGEQSPDGRFTIP